MRFAISETNIIEWMLSHYFISVCDYFYTIWGVWVRVRAFADTDDLLFTYSCNWFLRKWFQMNFMNIASTEGASSAMKKKTGKEWITFMWN